MASPLFCHGLLDDFGVKTFIGVHFFKSPILGLQLTQPRQHRGSANRAECGFVDRLRFIRGFAHDERAVQFHQIATDHKHH